MSNTLYNLSVDIGSFLDSLWSVVMNASSGNWPRMGGFAQIVFALVCAALMILASWWKRDLAEGSPLHEALDWSVQLLVVFVIIGISACGIPSCRLSCGEQQTR
jgi:hypothetical protein